MKNLFLLLCTSLVMSVSFSACKKDKDDPTPTKSKTDMLTQSGRKWKITADVTAITAAGATITNDNYATDYDACDKDDFVTFQASKVLVSDEGATKCVSSSPQTENGTWDFNSDQSKFLITAPMLGNTTITFDIVEITDATLKIKQSDNTSIPGAVSTQTITFSSF